MKNILITGKNSYVGSSFKKWITKAFNEYKVDVVDMIDNKWKDKDFNKYDVVVHVAAIVHKKEKSVTKQLYFDVNKNLTLEVAKKAKRENVAQFIFFSTMAVYGETGTLGNGIVINSKTPLNPKTYYAESKVAAEKGLIELNSPYFNVVILRPPMIYGPNCPRNYSRLEKFAAKFPIFPMIDNKRSMLHIDNLSMYLKEYIDNNVSGIYFPQDRTYINTSMLVKNIAEREGKSIHLSKAAGWFIEFFVKELKLLTKYLVAWFMKIIMEVSAR